MRGLLQNQTRPFLVVLIFSLLTLQGHAHHGANTNPELYLAENLVELEGEITRILWRNPHPRLMIKVVDGNVKTTQWELELSGSLHNWTSDGIDGSVFNIGDRVKAAGAVSRRNAKSMGLVHLLLPNGEELLRDRNRELRWSDVRLGSNAMASQPDPVAVQAAKESADGIFRVWGRRTSPRPRADQYVDVLTETGHETLARYYAPRDNPDFECRTGMPHHMFDPLPMEITDAGDRIIIETLEYNVKRVIYLTNDRPDPLPSNVGYSVGRWEGNTLIVNTTHVDWPYFDPFGTPQSNQVSYIETFQVAEDESQLNYSIVATDPVMFSEPLRLERAWLWQPGTEMFEFDCVPEWEDTE